MPIIDFQRFPQFQKILGKAFISLVSPNLGLKNEIYKAELNIPVNSTMRRDPTNHHETGHVIYNNNSVSFKHACHLEQRHVESEWVEVCFTLNILVPVANVSNSKTPSCKDCTENG